MTSYDKFSHSPILEVRIEKFSDSVLLMELSKCWNVEELPKISAKMKNFKTFYKAQTVRSFKEAPTSPPPPSPYNFWTKIFLRRYTGIYRHLLSKSFENAVPGRLEILQCKFLLQIFLTPTRNMFAGKFVKWVAFWLCC